MPTGPCGLHLRMKIGIITSAILFAARSVVCAAGCLEVAQTEIPSCGQSCFVENAPSVGCDGTDFVCQCQKEAALYAVIEPCVASGCPEPSFQAVIDGASSGPYTLLPYLLSTLAFWSSISFTTYSAGLLIYLASLQLRNRDSWYLSCRKLSWLNYCSSSNGWYRLSLGLRHGYQQSYGYQYHQQTGDS